MPAPNMSDVVAATLPEEHTMRPVVLALRDVVFGELPEVREDVNSWNIATFYAPHEFAYWNPASKHVTVGFLWGTSLPDPHGLLEGTGKNLRHVKIRKVEDLSKPGLKELIQAAAEYTPPKKGTKA